MDEAKWLKKKERALKDNNKELLYESCKKLAEIYKEDGNYEEALSYFQRAQDLCEKTVDIAVLNRWIGEVYCDMGMFEEAIEYQKKHLELSKQEANSVEIQRAQATLGRTYFIKGLSYTNHKERQKSLQASYDYYRKSERTCEFLTAISSFDLAVMKARLYLNIGLTIEALGTSDESIGYLHKAITISKSHDLTTELTQCYTRLAEVYLKQQKHSEALATIQKCIGLSNNQSESNTLCELLLLKCDVYVDMFDFQSAKMDLVRAYKLKHLNSLNREDVEKKLKLIIVLVKNENKLLELNIHEDDAEAKSNIEHAKVKKIIYEQMGDACAALGNYGKAIHFYHKMLEACETIIKITYSTQLGIGLSDSLDSACSELHTVLSSDLCKDLASCYISLAQTYKDNKQYNLAVDYFNKELRLHARNFPEAVKTLGEIGDLYELQEKSFEIVQSTHEKALDLARQNKDDKLIRTVMRSMKKLYKKHDKFTELERIKTELKSLEEKLELNSSSDEEDTILEDSPNIGDDINLEELSDLNSGDEESKEDQDKRTNRKRAPRSHFLIKRNDKGETALHVAAARGNLTLVQSLLKQGHPVKVQDSAGWLPLHEAANHGHTDIVQALDSAGWLPLHEAANHGHTDIVQALVSAGADPNDKGGTGISPLHDAAANGYLEVIEILLDKGASTAQKTNQGETALALLQECKARVERTQGSLDPAVEAHFEQVVRKLRVPDELTKQQSVGRTQQPSESNRTQLENRRRESVRGLELSTPKRSERESRGLSLRNRRELSPSPETPGDLRDRSLSPISVPSSPNSPRNRNDVCNLGSSSEEESATREYQKAISNLRSHTVKNHTFGKPAQVKVRQRQFLEDTEVGDDWLEKDVEVGNGKKRKYYKDDGQGRDEVEPKRVRNNETRKPDALRYEPSSSRKSDSPRFEPSSRKSDSPNKLATLPPRIPEVVRRKSNSPPRQLAIVSRAYEPSQMFCPEDMGDLEPVLTRAESNEYLNRADNVATMSGFNTHLSSSNTNLASSRDRLSGCSAQNTFPNTCNPPISSIKIKIESHVFLIPILNDHHAGEKKISWLKQEASERYYRLEGVTPVLRIKTQDGALVDDNDPLASVLTEALVHTEVIAWKKPPLTERYNQLCTEHGVSTHKHFVHALSNADTPRFTICTCAKSTPMLLTLFRTILHWTDLVELHLARSFLQDDDIKALSENLKNLSKLQKLNLSCNRISHLGLKYLSEQCASVRQLRDLDVSFNPLTNASLPHINNMVASCPLSTLNLSHTGITRLDSNLNLYNIESITISRNKLGAQEVRKLLSLLNADLLVHLHLSATLETPTTSLLEKPRGNVSSNAHERRSPCKSPNLYFQSDKTSRDEDDLNLPDIISMVPRNSPNKDNTNILVENQTKCTNTSQDMKNCANKINTDKPNAETSDKPKISNIDDTSQKELDRILNSSPIMDKPRDNINIPETASQNELDRVLNSSPIIEMPQERSNSVPESAGFQNQLDRVLNSSPIMEMPHEPRNGNANSANMLKSHRNHGNANSANVKSRPSQDAVPRSPGITREVCLFLEQSERIRLKSLSLCDINMTDEEASMLYNVLKTVTSITRLDVSNRCLSQRSVELLKSVVTEAD